MILIPKDELIKELRRELAVRKSVYPKWVNGKKLKQLTADFRIACIEQVIALLEAE
jgi:hypothetical protein